MDSRWWCTVHQSKKGTIALHSHVFAFHIAVSGRLVGRSHGHVTKKFFTSSAAILNVGHSVTSLQFNVRMWWMLFSITTTGWFQFVEPNLKYTVPRKILPELFYSCTCYEDLPSLSAAAPCSSSWLIHRQCSNKKNSDRGRIWNYNHSNVAVTHVRQIYSQHSFGLPRKMNAMQSGHTRMNLSVKTLITSLYATHHYCSGNGIPNQYNYDIKISEKKMIVLQRLNVRLVQCLLLFQFYTLSALHKEQAIPCCLIHRLKELELLQEDRRPKQKCKSLAEKSELNMLR